jgi:hypothetical protein
VPTGYCLVPYSSLVGADRAGKIFVEQKFVTNLCYSAAEGIALFEIAALQTAAKPSNALFSAPMSETLRDHIPLRPHLDAIIANLSRGVQALFHVSFFKNLAFAVRLTSPDPRETIGL